jgi:hypothetical protein
MTIDMLTELTPSLQTPSSNVNSGANGIDNKINVAPAVALAISEEAASAYSQAMATVNTGGD